MTFLIQFVGMLLYILAFAIFVRAILSWFPIDRSGPLFQTLDAITEPVLQPLRRIIPPIGMIDITPMVAMILLFIISSMLLNYAG